MSVPMAGGYGAAAGVQRQTNVIFFQLEAGTNHVPKIYRKQEGRLDYRSLRTATEKPNAGIHIRV
jgi:hypothetical protein